MSESAEKSDKSLRVWRFFLELSWTVATLAAFAVPLAARDRARGDEPHWYTGWWPTLALYVVAIGGLALYATSRWRILKAAVDTDRASNRAVFWITLSMFAPLIVGTIYVFIAWDTEMAETPWSVLAALTAVGARWGSEEYLAKQAEQAEQASPSAPEPR